MSEIHTHIPTLVVRSLIGETTPAEITQLEEWASLSVENRIWLDRFNDHEWVMKRTLQMEAVSREDWTGDLFQRLQLDEERSARLKRRWQYAYASVAAVILIFGGTWLYKYLVRDAVSNLPLTHTTPTATNRDKKPEITIPIAPTANSTTDENDYFNQSFPDNSAIDKTSTQPGPSPAQPQQPAAQFVSRQGAFGNTITGPRVKDHKNINKERTIQPGLLPDGSSFTLNAGSEIEYPDIFDGACRMLKLSGEAYVTVVPNDSVPLRAVTDGTLLTTYGGAFNIRCYDNEKLTTITAVAGKLAVTAGPYNTTLAAGETAIIKKGSPIEIYNKRSRDKALAYTKLLFHFHNDDLNLVATELARWYGLTLVGVNKAHIRVSFRGHRTMKPEEVLKKITSSDGRSHLKIQGTKLILE